MTPAGCIEVSYDEHYVYRAVLGNSAAGKAQGQLGTKIAEQLEAYQQNPHYHFQLPLKPLGSPYQQRVWNALLVIPVGRTVTYGELATIVQSSPRAIGQACKRNPLALFIPCHRVVGKNDQGGYMGRVDALPYKIALLEHERYVRNP